MNSAMVLQVHHLKKLSKYGVENVIKHAGNRLFPWNGEYFAANLQKQNDDEYGHNSFFKKIYIVSGKNNGGFPDVGRVNYPWRIYESILWRFEWLRFR